MGEQVSLRWQLIHWLAVANVVADPVVGQSTVLTVALPVELMVVPGRNAD